MYQERDDGIVIRGAQMLGTAAAIADWLLLTCIQPLREGDQVVLSDMSAWDQFDRIRLR